MRYRRILTPNTVKEIAKTSSRIWYTADGGYWGPWGSSTSITNSQVVSKYPNAVHCGVFDEPHKGPPYLEGGPFNKWAFRTNAAIPQCDGTFLSRIYGSRQYRYVGGLVTAFYPDYTYFPGMQSNLYLLNAGSKTYYPDGTHTYGDISSYGAKAWKKFSPGRASADMGTFLGELREVPKMLKQTARRFHDLWKGRVGRTSNKKELSGDWLAYNFGWLPFLSDLRSFYRTWRKADRVMRYLVEHNGKWVKRGGTVQEVEDVEILQSGTIPDWNGTYCVLGDLYYTAGFYGSRTLRRITAQKVWFEGRFRYYIPNIRSVEWNRTFIQKLFGLQITPSLVWNLTPWSWLVDWFTNVGDIVDNISGPGLAENLVAKYAYLMGTKSTTLTETKTLSLVDGPKTLEYYWSLERKTRSEANPFGFGVTYDGLSARQWSLLVALGLQRS